MLASLALLMATAQSEVSFLVSDTFIDAAMPGQNFGRDPYLESGGSRAILLRFEDLPENVDVVSATVVLTPGSPVEDASATVSALRSPWAEGGGFRGPFGDPGPEDRGATWQRRIDGVAGHDWQSNGAGGMGDRQSVAEATAYLEGDRLFIDGLADTFQTFADHPHRNHGLRIQFQQPIRFYSTENAALAPRLLLVTEPRTTEETASDLRVESLTPAPDEPNVWVADIANVSDQPSGAVRVEWFLDGQELGGTSLASGLAAGESREFRRTLPEVPGEDPRAGRLTVAAEAEVDATPSENSLAVYTRGLPVTASSESGAWRMWHEQLDDFNQLLGQARYSFARDGLAERVRFAGFGESDFALVEPTSENLVDLLAGTVEPAPINYSAGWEGVNITPADGDRRDDTAWPSTIPIIRALWKSEFSTNNDLVERSPELLDKATAARIYAKTGLRDPEARQAPLELPSSTIVRLTNTEGEPIELAAYAVHTVNQAGERTKLTDGFVPASGTIFVPLQQLEDWLVVSVQHYNRVGHAWTSREALAAERIRTGTATIALEERYPAPRTWISDERNHAEGALVTDSQERFPAQLIALTDGDPATSIELPNEEGAWVEVDLGRDWLLGELALTTPGTLWDEFEVYVYNTGESFDRAREWMVASLVNEALRLRGTPGEGATELVYYGEPVRARYVRLVCVEPANDPRLAELTVRPVLPEPPEGYRLPPPPGDRG